MIEAKMLFKSKAERHLLGVKKVELCVAFRICKFRNFPTKLKTQFFMAFDIILQERFRKSIACIEFE